MSLIQNSGLRIIKIINILMKNPSSRDEVCFELDKDEMGVYTNTVSKYLRTLRSLGFEIKKENNKFSILKTPFKIKLTKQEEEGFETCDFIVKTYYTKEAMDTYQGLKNKILNNIEKKEEEAPLEDNVQVEDKTTVNIDTLSKYISSFEIEISAKYLGKEVKLIPEELRYKKNGIFLLAYDCNLGDEALFSVAKMDEITINSFFPRRKNIKTKNTTFKITGRLQKNYVPKENETVHYIGGSMIVTNNFQKKEELFNRLLKYGKYCEVLYPESDRLAFIEKIKSLREYYKSM